MHQVPKSTFIILLGIFAVFDLASAQITNPPQQIINQNPPPFTNTENLPVPSQPEEQLTIQEPESQIQPVKEEVQPQVLPQENPSPIEETPSQILPQETSPEITLSENIADQKSVRQLDLSSPAAYLAYATVIILVFFWLNEWWRKWGKRKKKTELPAEAEKLVCSTCGGSGKITKYRIKTAPCGHCKETGNDICHHCS